MEPIRIGKYTASELIGRGTMSDVFRAFDSSLNRVIALKTVSRRLVLTDAVREKFYEEARSAAQLSHPNIITVYELGEEDGNIFIAMELLEGANLRQLLDSKEQPSRDQRLDLMEQIAEGIGFAHVHGVVHRDLKPANIHVQPGNQVKITDFSLSTLVTSDSTRSGAVIVNPDYMSPEQVRGDGTDAPSDVFSLGAMLYELLSLRKPFTDKALHLTLMKVMKADRPPLTDIAPDVPLPLVRVVDKALALSPRERFRDGNELLQALRESRDGARVRPVAKGSAEGTTIHPSPPTEPAPPSVPTRSLAGSLKSVHLADLLLWCSIQVKTGTLRVRQGPVEKRLYFRDGQLFSSSSNSPREVLGQFLIRSRHISEEQLFRALLEQERTQEPLGWILISQNILGRADLQKILRLQCEESIYDCFLWTNGEFSFEEHQIPGKVPVTFALDISHVIEEGIGQMEKWGAIRKQFSSRLTTFVLVKGLSEPPGGAASAEEERRVLELAGKGKTLSEIALELHASDFYAACLLLKLRDGGHIRIGRVPEELPYESHDPGLRDRLAEALSAFRQDQHAKILAAVESRLDTDARKPSDTFDDLSRIIEEADKIKKVPREGIPAINVPLEELGRIDLTPQEGFVLSRINGEWDIRSILKICPLSELDALKIIKGLLERGIIEITSN